MNHDDRAGLAIAERLRRDVGRAAGPDARSVGDFPAFCVAASLLKRGRFDEAADVASHLVARYPEPGHPEAVYVLALCALWGSRDWATAETALRHVVTHRPAIAEYWYNLGFAIQRQGRDDEAAEVYERCLALKPDLAGALVNLGNARLARGRLEEARTCFTRAARSPESGGLARYNRAIAQFFLGEWAAGWADYEYRWENPEFLSRVVRPPYPVWDGSPPRDGQRLLVFAEQGLGDTLMCWRYADRLAHLWGGRVEWVVQPALAPLLGCRPMQGQWPDADLALPAMSCMHRLGMVTGGAPYLPRTLPRGGEDARLRVGYVWAGSPGHENDARRSTDRGLWDGLLAVPGVEWVELQVGRGGSYQPKDWRETADLVNSLDLVITVDTSLAHLAGAMGTPVWILLPSYPDYRWGLESDRTIWYDSARLFRQRQDGDWPDVLARVQRALEDWRT
jgi:TolA-binding protein